MIPHRTRPILFAAALVLLGAGGTMVVADDKAGLVYLVQYATP